jgi:hypothetical protein
VCLRSRWPNHIISTSVEKDERAVSSSKVLYESFSVYQFLIWWITRIFIFGIIVSATIHFDENPILISFVIIFGIFFIIKSGQPSIRVYVDRFEHTNGSLLRSFRGYNKYYYKDISSITVNGDYTLTFDVLGDLLIPVHFTDPSNSIDLIFFDHREESNNTRIYKIRLRKTLKIIIEQYNAYHHSLKNDNRKK